MKLAVMKTNSRNYLNYLVPGLLCLVILSSVACSAKIVRGASPMVRMTELSHQDGMVNLQLNIRNINGVDMSIRNIDVELSMDNEASLRFDGPADVNIAANGVETWNVELQESEAGRDLLNSLENGDINSLPYRLTGSVVTLEDGSLRYEYEGHIYPLPGRQGYFR